MQTSSYKFVPLYVLNKSKVPYVSELLGPSHIDITDDMFTKVDNRSDYQIFKKVNISYRSKYFRTINILTNNDKLIELGCTINTRFNSSRFNEKFVATYPFDTNDMYFILYTNNLVEIRQGGSNIQMSYVGKLVNI